MSQQWGEDVETCRQVSIGKDHCLFFSLKAGLRLPGIRHPQKHFSHWQHDCSPGAASVTVELSFLMAVMTLFSMMWPTFTASLISTSKTQAPWRLEDDTHGMADNEQKWKHWWPSVFWWICSSDSELTHFICFWRKPFRDPFLENGENMSRDFHDRWDMAIGPWGTLEVLPFGMGKHESGLSWSVGHSPRAVVNVSVGFFIFFIIF